MSGTRSRLDLDYAELNSTGRRVPKVREKVQQTKMDNLDIQAINASSDFEDFLDSYDIDNLEDEEELSEYLNKIGEIKRTFRRVYAQIKITEGEGFDAKYPNYDNERQEISVVFQEANKKLTELKKTNKAKTSAEIKIRNDLEAEKLAQEMASIKRLEDEKRSQAIQEWKFRVDQLVWFSEVCAWETKFDVDDIQHTIVTLESYLNQVGKASAEVRGVLGDDGRDFLADNEKVVAEARDHIKLGTARLQSVREEKLKAQEALADREASEKLHAEEERIRRENLEERAKIRDLMTCAQSLGHEVKNRYDTLKNKVKIDLSKLTDFEVLDLKKKEDSVSLELRELLDKVSSLLQYVVPCGDAARLLRENVKAMRDDASLVIEAYIQNVNEVILDRDISEKKLKNSAGLDIKIPKFKGYESEMNIFTFRSEFKKLVEPYYQKCLLADYLKKNLLIGPAHNLVSGIEDIDLIWRKLTEVYGNTQLLLQNKIGSLSKISNLDRLHDDEKISFALSSILNIMEDLRKLAVEYDLQAELYYGGGLQKVLDMIGKQRERKFIKSTAKEQLKNEHKWVKLVDFLQNELLEREAYILNEKSKKCLTSDNKTPKGKDTEDKRKADSKQGSVQNSNSKSFPVDNKVPQKCLCSICGKDEGHVLSWDSNKKPFVHYVACKVFVDKTSKERDNLLFKKRLCNKCLTPGAKFGSTHECDQTYVCGQKFLRKRDNTEQLCQKHVLVCGHHCEEESNKKLLELYKKNVIQPHGKFFDFTKNISISCYSEAYRCDSGDSEDADDSGIFAFQTIDVAPGLEGNGFYDSGCGKGIVRKEFKDKLESIGRATLIRPGPIILEGVNQQSSSCDYGEYCVRLELKNGTNAEMKCICLENITIPFPKYPLKTVEEDILKEVGEIDKDILPRLPRLPDSVGGPVDIMIGTAYLKFSPREIARLESGLTIYDSMFKSPDGSTGVVAGPHPEFLKAERLAHFASESKKSYYVEPVLRYLRFLDCQNNAPLLGIQRSFIDPDMVSMFPKETCTHDEIVSTDSHSLVPLSGKVTNECDIGDLVAGGGVQDEFAKHPASLFRCGIHKNCDDCQAFVARAPKLLKKFEDIENSGTNISYRCIRCRECKDCTKGALVEEISIKGEYQQSLIDKSVTLDTEKMVCTALLPFIEDPDRKLVTNERSARKVYNNVVRKLAKNDEDRKAVIEAEQKLHTLGFVDWIENLPEEDQKLIFEAHVQYYIPWRVVWSDSLSTPVRPVFDASMRPSSGNCLNEIVATVTNNMNNLQQMIIRWLGWPYAYHADVSKCYNGVKLDKKHWRFQLYWFEKDLDPEKEPKVKVVKTIIYGVRSSGNQAERALRLTADTYETEFPMAHGIIHNDIYVDDCLSGEATEEARDEATDQLQQCLSMASFSLKAITYSGHDPDPKVSADGESISVAGRKWFPKGDFLMLNVGEVILSRKVRGRRVKFASEYLTVTDCASIVAQLFDPTGLVAPLIGGLKVDVSYLHRNGLTWGDAIPENLRSLWSSNAEMIREIGSLKYKRAVVPPDAKNLNLVTIDTGDSSNILICVAIYARFEKRDGSFSCQLVLARTKVLPEGTTTPRGEMMAAVMNAATGYTVKKAFGDRLKKSFKLTDSTVALTWICSEVTILKTWVRARAIECNRLSTNWFYVKSEDMIADLGTRKGVKIEEVAEGSNWINGYPWMSGPEEDFPTKTLEEINLSQKDLDEVSKDTMVVKSFHVGRRAVVERETDEQIELRYKFSSYLLDPNRHRFRKSVRILALSLTFLWKISKNVPKVRENLVFKHVPPGGVPDVLKCTNDRYIVTTAYMGLKTSPGGKVVEVTDKMLQASVTYFSLKASNEVKHFLVKKKYVNISKEIDGILYYSGRILEDYQFDGYPDLCAAAIDLSSTTFCVPLTDQCSPVGIAVALEVHWHHPDVCHRGIETIYRQMLRVAYIIGGRQLATSIKQGCRRCRSLYKKSLEVAMGPIQNVNLCIAPPFFASQIDILGSYKAYSIANLRTTRKTPVGKIWFAIFCCTTTGAIDVRVMEDYSTDSVVLAFIRFSCRYGYPKYLMPDAGSQLLKSCEEMRYSFTDVKQKLAFDYDVEYSPCPVGAHYVHGKVERKIREVKKSINISVQNEKLSQIQWETLMHQISNSINNLPIGLKNSTSDLDNLDLITPNRLILGRNNNRSPNAPLTLCNDHKKLIDRNATIFRAWFKAWLTSYVPNLIERPKWHKTDEEVSVGDIVLFLKNDKEYDEQYQYGQICEIYRGNDGLVRKADVKYKNHNENVFRTTKRGVRELVIISPIHEVDIYERLDHMM